jgi:hypothetical protein
MIRSARTVSEEKLSRREEEAAATTAVREWSEEIDPDICLGSRRISIAKGGSS